MDKNILTILTETDREEIKRALKDIIIEQIRQDFNETANYLFDSSTIENMINEAIEEVKAEIKPILHDFMLKQMKEKLGIEQF